MDVKEAGKEIKGIVLKHLGPEFKVFLFGSRASANARKWSDFDVGIEGKKPVDFKVLGLINEELENTNIPYKVDVVDFSRVSTSFKKTALERSKIWKKKG
ncbi:MAG: nucleotidyltransferase domain-containing protein [Patescibacteria group bacterium]